MGLNGVTRAAAALGMTGLLVALLGCAGTASSHRSPGPSESATVARAAGTTTVGCSMSRPLPSGDSPTSDDVVTGPLSYPGLAHGYPGEAPDARGGITFAKVGAQLMPDATATVSIAAEARSWAGIVTETGPPAGYSSVTYVSCPASQSPDGVWWVGGFTLENRSAGCLPLDISVAGERSPRHIVISLWDPDCA